MKQSADRTVLITRRIKRIVAPRSRRVGLEIRAGRHPILYALSRDTLRRGGGSWLSAGSVATWEANELPDWVFAREPHGGHPGHMVTIAQRIR